jgi:hypothetical protein
MLLKAFAPADSPYYTALGEELCQLGTCLHVSRTSLQTLAISGFHISMSEGTFMTRSAFIY